MNQIEQIQDWFIHHKHTLSVAESCTGGALSACLTKQPGCSQYFLGSIIAYSNRLKTSVLGVDSEVLRIQGAVSEPVVRQMVKGIIHLTGSAYGVAVSGIAGPGGGSQSKPVGTVWAAIGRQGEEPYSWSVHLLGGREQIIQQAVDILLQQLGLFINEG